MERITSCRVCGAAEIKEFFDLGNQPFANALLDNPRDPDPFYPLSLSFCSNCSLVQLDHTASPSELFSKYVWVTGTSKTAQAHAQTFCDELLKRTGDLQKSYVLEVASNDGTFLVPFKKAGYAVLGIDPAKNIAEAAQHAGIPTRSIFFGNDEAKKILAEHGPASAVFARNVLPHVANTHDFVQGLAAAVSAEGLVAIECHYAKIILDELHYDSIYHEHLCYFTLKSLERLLNQYGLYVFDITVSPISGGSIIVYARKSKSAETPVVGQYRAQEEKEQVNTLGVWQEFAKFSFTHRGKLLRMIDEVKREGQQVMGWGASARSSTLLNFCGIDTSRIAMIADKNSLKHKKYTAGTHIMIDDPEVVMRKKPDVMVILAWNFAKEIMEELRDRYNFQGACVVPLPKEPRLIRL